MEEVIYHPNETENTGKTDFFSEMYEMRPSLVSTILMTTIGKSIFYSHFHERVLIFSNTIVTTFWIL